MKVILTEDVAGTGKKGQSLEVKDGFGRNFLIPRGLAIPATEGNVKRFEHIVKDILGKKERHAKAAEEMKVSLEQATLIIRMKAGAEGKLFGSVTPKDIAEALEKSLRISIDKKLIRIDEPIKNTGAHTVDIHLEQGIHAALKIEVEQET